ncbi:hypothetical protein WJX74_010772 [Apatococcus lobatus]|uniref:UDP-glucuronosyltransferase n=1 Tax=Apatococcus lobatus TaxID=904363 RepID=A0AAW1Q4Y1_9CHLO
MNVLRIGQELAARGHKFLWIISDSEPASRTLVESRSFDNLTILEYNAKNEQFAKGDLARDPVEFLRTMKTVQQHSARRLFHDKVLLQHLHDAGIDLLLKDASSRPASLLASFLGVPAVDVLPIPMSLPLFKASYSVPHPVAYIPSVGTPFTPEMTLLQRVSNLAASWAMLWFAERPLLRAMGNLADEFGVRYSDWHSSSGVSQTAAVISTLDWAFEYPFPVPPKVHMVGPVLVSPAEPLPDELDSFLSSGLNNGHKAVYVSMGTLGALCQSELHDMARELSALPNPVLWKLPAADLPGNLTLANFSLGPNIKLIDWAPQNDVLGHPSMGAFVTQGGINSIYEAMFNAVPVLVIGLTADQPQNAVKAGYFGFGIPLKPAQLHEKNLVTASIRRLLSEPSFKANATKMQRRMHWTRHPAEKAADVVEKVLLTGGEDWLQTGQHTLTWWQNSLLDVYAALSLVAAAILSLVSLVCWGIYRAFRRALVPKTSHVKQT